MARSSLLQHPKFLRLVRELKMPTAHVLGHLELLFQRCYEMGDDFLGDDDDVEDLAGWVGDPGVLVKALASCGGRFRAGLIDSTDGGGWRIHDLEDHAPDYVKKRMARARAKREAGANRRQSADTGDHPAPNGAERRHCPPNGAEREHPLTQPNLTPPNRTHTQPCNSTDPGYGGELAKASGEIDDKASVVASVWPVWWKIYPTKTHQEQSRRAICELDLQDILELEGRTRAWLVNREVAKKAGEFVPKAPGPCRFLREKRWLDRIEVGTQPGVDVGKFRGYPWSQEDQDRFAADPRWDRYLDDCEHAMLETWPSFEEWATRHEETN